MSDKTVVFTAALPEGSHWEWVFWSDGHMGYDEKPGRKVVADGLWKVEGGLVMTYQAPDDYLAKAEYSVAMDCIQDAYRAYVGRLVLEA